MSTLMLLSLIGCSSGPPETDVTTVAISGFRFQPERVEARSGTTLRWENSDDILHTVTEGTPDSPGGGLLDGTLDGQGTSYEIVAADPGEHPYFCDRHNSMVGVLVVT